MWRSDTDGGAGSGTHYGVTLPDEASADGVTLGVPATSAAKRTLPPDDADFGVRVEPEGTVERVTLQWPEGRTALHLPTEAFHARCRAAVDGDTAAARDVVAAFDSPVRAVLVCGEFLDVAATVRLVGALAETDRYVESVLHSYRYPLVRSALLSDAGLSVTTRTELETLVDGLDELPAVGAVTTVEAVADAVATGHPRAVDPGGLVESLGYDLDAFDTAEDGLYLTCRLATRLLNGDLRDAVGVAMGHRWALDGNYDRRKTVARQAEYPERGAAWRRLLCAAARESLDEFAYVLANACHWSAEDVQSDGRLDELLYRGAVRAAETIDLEEVSCRARYARHLSGGHRLRSNGEYALSAARFQRAIRIAETTGRSPTWQPRYNWAVVEAHRLRDAQDHDAAVAVLEETTERLRSADVPDGRVTDVVRHLTAQRAEVAADACAGSRPTEAADLLAEARRAYERLGFDRSADRVARKASGLERPGEGTDETAEAGADEGAEEETAEMAETEADERPDAEPSTQTPTPPDECDPTPTPSPDGPADGEAGSTTPDAEVVEAAKEGDHREGNDPFPEDTLVAHDPTAVGGRDLMTSPDDRHDPDDARST